MRVIAYTRVSKADRRKPADEQRRSLDVQRAAIESAAAVNRWDLVEVVEDLGKTGANTRRDGLQAVLARLKKGDAEMLCVARLDRLSRDTVDFGTLLRASEKQGWAVSVLDQRIETTTASGWLQASIVAVFAEYERRLTAERTRDALASLKADGKQLGRPSPVSGDVELRILDLYHGGHSATAIARRLTEDRIPTPRGGKAWTHAVVLGVVRRNEAVA